MLQKCSIIKVANIFFSEPTKQHYLIEISRKSKIAHTSVKKYLNQLVKSSIIIKNIEKRGSRKFPLYKANINHKKYKQYKSMANLYSIKESRLIQHFADKIMPKCIILFGSYNNGEDIEESDIDLFVESPGYSLDLSKYEKILNRKIQLHFRKNFREFPEELKNNIINGTVLYGYLEAFSYDNPHQKRQGKSNIIKKNSHNNLTKIK